MPGAVFHGLRHFHKTLLDETGSPDMLVHERMGHQMPGIAGVYSHVTPTVRTQLTHELQMRWTRLTGNEPDHNPRSSTNRERPGALLPADHDPYMGRVLGPVEQPAPDLLPMRPEQGRKTRIPRPDTRSDLGTCGWAILGLNQ